MQSMLGTNRHMPLLHMDKIYIWLEEKNQLINELSIGYMMNPNLHKKKAFREQVKVCLKNTFVTYTTAHISKILLKSNTIVLALVMFYENRGKYTKKFFRVLSCVIYTIISKYFCIDYVGSEKSKLSDLRLGVAGRYKHPDKI